MRDITTLCSLIALATITQLLLELLIVLLLPLAPELVLWLIMETGRPMSICIFHFITTHKLVKEPFVQMGFKCCRVEPPSIIHCLQVKHSSSEPMDKAESDLSSSSLISAVEHL